MSKAFADWRRAWLALYGLAVLAMIVLSSPPDSVIMGMTQIAFLLAGSAPVALLCLTPRHALGKGVGAVLIGGLGLWIYVETLFILPPDAQSALVFVFVPVWQAVAVAVWLIAVLAIIRIRQRTSR